MAHCPIELLDDLADVFAEVRTWATVVEKRPGVFYRGRQPFFHFHLMPGGSRRGDIKHGREWAALDLPRPLSATRRRALLRALRAALRGPRAGQA
jgi:hypothetical protein